MTEQGCAPVFTDTATRASGSGGGTRAAPILVEYDFTDIHILVGGVRA